MQQGRRSHTPARLETHYQWLNYQKPEGAASAPPPPVPPRSAVALNQARKKF